MALPEPEPTPGFLDHPEERVEELADSTASARLTLAPTTAPTPRKAHP